MTSETTNQKFCFTKDWRRVWTSPCLLVYLIIITKVRGQILTFEPYSDIERNMIRISFFNIIKITSLNQYQQYKYLHIVFIRVLDIFPILHQRHDKEIYIDVRIPLQSCWNFKLESIISNYENKGSKFHIITALYQNKTIHSLNLCEVFCSLNRYILAYKMTVFIKID